MRPRRPRPIAASDGPTKSHHAAVLCCPQDSHLARVFISLATTYLLLVLAKLGVALAPPVRIAGYVAITCAVAAWHVAFPHVINATFGRDLIPTRLLA
jgi:succinate-acetate transporter protein